MQPVVRVVHRDEVRVIAPDDEAVEEQDDVENAGHGDRYDFALSLVRASAIPAIPKSRWTMCAGRSPGKCREAQRASHSPAKEMSPRFVVMPGTNPEHPGGEERDAEEQENV
jgi:hypothetical protein